MKQRCILFVSFLVVLSCSAPPAPRHHAKILVVGMPGDYAPFALCEGDAATNCHGHDVDLIRVFAKYLGRQARFVRSSWSTLGEELAAHRFMVAVGGISVTEERKRVGPFGAAILSTGKQALMRCMDRDRFSTWEQVLLARIVTNRGGTNQSFATRHFAADRIVVVEKNEHVPGALVRREVDVFFTDGPEAGHLSRIHESLCIGLKAQLYEPFDLAFWFASESLRDDFNDFVASPEGQRHSKGLVERHRLSAR